jgi:hypothetical protein
MWPHYKSIPGIWQPRRRPHQIEVEITADTDAAADGLEDEQGYHMGKHKQ